MRHIKIVLRIIGLLICSLMMVGFGVCGFVFFVKMVADGDHQAAPYFISIIGIIIGIGAMLVFNFLIKIDLPAKSPPKE